MSPAADSLTRHLVPNDSCLKHPLTLAAGSLVLIVQRCLHVQHRLHRLLPSSQHSQARACQVNKQPQDGAAWLPWGMGFLGWCRMPGEQPSSCKDA